MLVTDRASLMAAHPDGASPDRDAAEAPFPVRARRGETL